MTSAMLIPVIMTIVGAATPILLPIQWELTLLFIPRHITLNDFQ